MKPKKTQPKDSTQRQTREFFQTPDYATDLIVPYLSGNIWECAAGDGYITKRLKERGFGVEETDIVSGFNFLSNRPFFKFDMIVTNPPFSLKKEFFFRALSYDVPFALLLPTDFCGWTLRAMRDNGAKWLVPTRRISFITPTGRSGKNSNPQVHSGWFCVGLNLPSQVTVVELQIQPKPQLIKNVPLPLFTDA